MLRALICAVLAMGVAMIGDTALAQGRRICEGHLSGPAGYHNVAFLVEGDEVIDGLAYWAPPNQTAVRGRDIPMMRLYYPLLDLETAERGPLAYIYMILVAEIGNERAYSAMVNFRRYGQREYVASVPWGTFGDSRENSERDSISSLAGAVGVSSPAALELANTAPQIEVRAITDRDNLIASGIWNLSYRAANDALFDRAAQQAFRQLQNPSRCRQPRTFDWPLTGMSRNRRTG
jgi:hypothetical protein